MNSAVLLPASFAILLAGALLFTNGIEWFGSMLNLGQGAVGSVLAAVATALPESLIPIVAIIGGERGSKDVAVGAIIGAPLVLATIAMALVGVAALLYRGGARRNCRSASTSRRSSATSCSSSGHLASHCSTPCLRWPDEHLARTVVGVDETEWGFEALRQALVLAPRENPVLHAVTALDTAPAIRTGHQAAHYAELLARRGRGSP